MDTADSDRPRRFYRHGKWCHRNVRHPELSKLFLGGWHLQIPSWEGGFHWALIDGSGEGWRGIAGGLFNIATFFAKVIALLVVFIWVRWTLPRFRYDQLMRLGWVFFFEIALVNIFVATIILAYFPK